MVVAGDCEAVNCELSERSSVSNDTVAQRSTNFRRWIRIAIYTFLVLSGQAAATLLGRQYYDKGGKSKWLATLVQLVGFPILLPFYCIQLSKSPNRETIIQRERPTFSVLASIYVSLGLLVAADCYLYSVGLLYLPVSTYSLICASQLAFNACFSFFLNSLKFTPFVLNSLFLLTISSTLLVFQKDDSTDTTDTSKGKYAIGFICTVAASAGYGLVLSLEQLAFKKVIKSKTFTAVLDMIVYINLVASCVIVVGLFASSEWKSLAREMEEYKLGKVSYVMNLVWTAITWQVFSIGSVGMIVEASSLFSNAISVLGLPIVPVLAVVFFHDKMNGLKVIAMLLAIWGFLSFVFQHYLNDCKSVYRPENVRRWIRIAIHAFFVLSGQSAATLLGTLYFKKGGNSKWMATLVQLAGFPVLFPYYCIPQSKKTKTVKIQTKTPSFLVLASVYFFLGLFIAVYCYLYSVGLMYLPVSTFSLICASQLAFNAFFSFFLNSQKFTPFIINSLMLLTISSTLLVFQKQDDSANPTGVSKGKYAIGFICTVAASAGYGLLLSLLQLAFKKVVKSETFTAVMDMVIYPCLVASCVVFVGLFVSNEWKTIPREMEEYELGKVSYVMTLVWIAIAWQVFNIGALGLIFEASSLFSNAISVVGLPIVPILAVVFFHDKMDGLKVISLVLAIWGFLSYVYQHYLDECQSKTDDRRTNVVPSASSIGNQ